MDPDAGPNPDQLTAVGWAFSFAWRLWTENTTWTTTFAGVDLALARACFEAAAETGYWAALNNLGVLYRDGLGVPVDPEKTFEYFRRAAESGEIAPLRHLARCYRDGFGCPVDRLAAEHIELMIADLEARAGTAKP
ncbi:hypothetical protein D516_2974 [Rhodobacter sp. AKP1]|nr:hypothetical protein D516_2974 [Rhodobacter sp. AKP1]